jgi:hypothetical protein
MRSLNSLGLNPTNNSVKNLLFCIIIFTQDNKLQYQQKSEVMDDVIEPKFLGEKFELDALGEVILLEFAVTIVFAYQAISLLVRQRFPDADLGRSKGWP